eukprot:7378453-Prymnesium_polylepis.3
MTFGLGRGARARASGFEVRSGHGGNIVLFGTSGPQSPATDSGGVEKHHGFDRTHAAGGTRTSAPPPGSALTAAAVLVYARNAEGGARLVEGGFSLSAVASSGPWCDMWFGRSRTRAEPQRAREKERRAGRRATS